MAWRERVKKCTTHTQRCQNTFIPFTCWTAAAKFGWCVPTAGADWAIDWFEAAAVAAATEDDDDEEVAAWLLPTPAGPELGDELLGVADELDAAAAAAAVLRASLAGFTPLAPATPAPGPGC